ncbi:TraK family protein [Shinella yambaruensis]|uniref:TraK family protein n=1 Tax=Shinella yambaruensis TaxID=415996 RepID=UPI003CC7FB7A
MATDRKRRKGMGRAAFLAHYDEIRRRLAEGEPQIVIYEDLEERIGIGYPQFSLYCRRFITPPSFPFGHQNGGAESAPAQSAPSPAETDPVGSKATSPAPARVKKAPFEFDPRYDKGELY